MKKIITFFSILWILAIILLCTLPMNLSPIWNGEIPGHRNQYEIMAESLLHGHLYLDIEVSEELKSMDNPYDPEARRAKNIPFRWDHAYYNEHYYMYFGIVPTLLVFLPYRIITGTALTTYHATQIFSGLIILGFFAFFHLLRRKFFSQMNHYIYMLLGTAFSVSSVWFFSTTPALYCTAISSAIAMMIWSFYFYFKALFDTSSQKKEILFLILGATFGSLAFGCRPPVALSNLIMIPLLFSAIKKDVKKAFPICLPYFIVGISLMLYNYVRFDNPFEFGQAYQLTVADQSNYGLFSNIGIFRLLNDIQTLFLQTTGYSGNFPYLRFSGIFLEFPIYLLGIGSFLFSSQMQKRLKQNRLFSTIIAIFVTLFITTYAVIVMSPKISERYHSDFYYLLAILSFLILGHFYCEATQQKRRCLNILFIVFSVITIGTAILLFFIPNDYNWTAYYPDILESIQQKMRILQDFI